MVVELAFQPLAAHPFDHLARKIDIDAVFPMVARVESQGSLERVVLASDNGGQTGLFFVAAGILVERFVGKSCGVRRKLPQGDRPFGWAKPRRTCRVKPL